MSKDAGYEMKASDAEASRSRLRKVPIDFGCVCGHEAATAAPYRNQSLGTGPGEDVTCGSAGKPAEEW